MSQPFSIVHEQEIGFDDRGRVTNSEQLYVKLSVSLLKILSNLPGARLSALVCLALNEAKISLGQSNGLSLGDIEESSGFSERHVLRAVQFLTGNNFAIEVEERGPHSEKLYRISGYAWFGENRAAHPASNRTRRGDIHVTPSAQNVRGDMSSSSSETIQSRFELDSTTSTGSAPAILAECGILTRGLDLHGMTDHDAHAIAQYVTENPDGKRSPAGWVYTLLKANPRWRPPERKTKHWWGDEYDRFVKR